MTAGDGGSQDGRLSEMPSVDAGDQVRVGDIQSSAVAIGRGAVAYQGLSFEEVVDLFEELKSQYETAVWDGRIPYLGLKAYQEDDAQFFFGREELVEDLLGRLQEARFVVISGPSGSGKSSLARAGLFHALRMGRAAGSEKWVLAAMSPKGRPLENLALALGRDCGDREAAQAIREKGLEKAQVLHEQVELLRAMTDDSKRRFVLLVDQFEELFTQTKDAAEREAFIQLLTTAVGVEDGRTTVILSLRSDFVSNCALYPELRLQINKEKQFRLVGAMELRDLAKAITLPSLEVGAEIEPALVKQIIDDMKGEPGVLPLMSFALRDLFEAEKTKPGLAMDMTLQEYVDRGGIDEALERHADEVFQSFTEEQQALARSIFSKLITVGEGRLDTRRTTVFGDLVPAGEEAEAVAEVVGRLAEEDVRLVTTSVESDEEVTVEEIAGAQMTVTIAHESLIDSWPWLKRLVDENRELIALTNQIQSDARKWEANRDDGFLYRGGRLLNVEERLEVIRPNLDALSLRFIEASIAERERVEAQVEVNRKRKEALESQQRIGRVLRWGTGIIGVLLLVAVFLAYQSYRSEVEVADLKNRIQASQLAAAAGVELANDQDLAFLLATSGLGLNSQPDTLARYYNTVFIPYRRTLDGHEAPVLSASFSPDGSTIVTSSSDSTARVWDLAGNELASLGGHEGEVNSASFSPDGQRVVSASDDGRAVVWDLEGNELASLDGHQGEVNTASFSPDGSKIVTASSDYTAKVWDLKGNEVASLDGHKEGVNSANFSPDGQKIVTASSDHTAKVWDLKGNEVTFLEGHGDRVWSASFSPDGQKIVTASADSSAKIWDLEGKERASLNGITHVPWSAVFSPDGQKIVTVNVQLGARVWDVAGNILAQLDGHTSRVLAAKFSPDGRQIVTAGWDGSAKVWDLQGNELTSLDGHTDQVWSAEFSPDGEQIVTAGEDGSAMVWDVAGNEIALLAGHDFYVESAVYSPDGEEIVTASWDGSARVWDPKGNEIAILAGHTSVVWSAEFSPDGEWIVTASEDGSARVWDLKGNKIALLEGHESGVWSAIFNPDGQKIATASFDYSAMVWDLAGKEIAILDGHKSVVDSVAFSPDGRQIVTASRDGTARVWDLEGNEIALLEGHESGVVSAVFSPDGQKIATASEDGSAKVWDLEGNELVSLDRHTDIVWSAVFSPDGQKIATAGAEGNAKVWDLEGNELASLDSHRGGVVSAVFSSDGQEIVTASWDNSAKVWDVDGNEKVSLEGHKDRLNTAVFSPDGHQVLTASNDGTARVWAIYPDLEEKLTIARERLSRGFTEEECRRFFRDDLESCPRTVEELFALFEDDLAGE